MLNEPSANTPHECGMNRHPLDITSNVGEMISFHFVTLSIKLNPYKAPFLANNAKTTTRYNAQESPCFKRLDR